jgi:hypothetical protein
MMPSRLQKVDYAPTARRLRIHCAGSTRRRKQALGRELGCEFADAVFSLSQLPQVLSSRPFPLHAAHAVCRPGGSRGRRQPL